MLWNKNLAQDYRLTDQKADKQYSIWPTIVALAEPKGKLVCDIGCGRGMGSRQLVWAGAKRVIGIDNCEDQLYSARSQPLPRLEYRLLDMFDLELETPVEVITAPFVANYATSLEELTRLFERFYQNLAPGGRLVLVIDQPEGRDLRRFGAVKTLQGPPIDGTPIKIDLYRESEFICTLPEEIHYYRPESVEHCLATAGFGQIAQHRPIITPEGYQGCPEGFWEGYIEAPELVYLTATVPPDE